MSPLNNLPKNPHAILEIDGVIYDSWVQTQLFKSVEIDLVTNESSEARFEFFDPKFHFIDSFAGVAGVPQSIVRVFLGYGQDLGEPLYKGLLAQVQRGASATTFICFDMGFKMKLEKKAEYKNKKNDLEILKILAARNGLGFEGPEKFDLEPHRAMMQDEQTDWEHAMERAHDAGLVIFVRQDTLFAKFPAKTGAAVLTLENKRDFLLQNNFDFKYRTPENQDGRPRIIKHRRRGKGGRRIEGESNDTTTDQRKLLNLKRDISEPTKSKLSRRAQAQKDLEREHAFEGHISSAFPLNGERLDVRNTVAVNGIGKLFSGKYICDTVNYRFAPGALSVNLDLYRDANM